LRNGASLRSASQASDGAGTGLRSVQVTVIEKRGTRWYAYRADSHTWVRARSRAAALSRAHAVRLVPVGVTAWQYRLPGLRRGSLLVLLTARDQMGNTSARHAYARLLTRP